VNKVYEKALSMKAQIISDLPIAHSKALYDNLKSLGCEQLQELPCGFVCTFGRGEKTLIILESGSPVILFAAARLIKKFESDLAGCVKLFFGTADGICSYDGSDELLKADGAMALSLRMCSEPGLASGCMLSAQPESYMLRQEFQIKVKAVPGVRRTNPLTIALRVNLALHELMAQECPPHEMVHVQCGVLNAGQVANVAAEVAVLKGVLRSCGTDALKRAKKRMEHITAETVKAFLAEPELEWLMAYPAVKTDEKLTKRLADAIADVIGKENLILSLGGRRGDEYSLYSQEIPFAHFEYAINKTAGGNVAEEDILKGAAACANAALTYFGGGGDCD